MTRLLDNLRSLSANAVTAVLALAMLTTACASSAEKADAVAKEDSLAGKLLVASPSMPDPRFAKTVIFMVRHDDKGAMGLVVNRVIGVGSAAQLLEDAGVGTDDVVGDAKVRVHYGGPVGTERGFVLHSGDYAESNTMPVTEEVSLTSAVKVLTAIANGKGPDRRILAVGYSGWAPGQLENELARKDWVVVPSDGLVFDADIASKWRRAFERHGIEL